MGLLICLEKYCMRLLNQSSFPIYGNSTNPTKAYGISQTDKQYEDVNPAVHWSKLLRSYIEVTHLSWYDRQYFFRA